MSSQFKMSTVIQGWSSLRDGRSKRGGKGIHDVYTPPFQLALATVVNDFGFLTRTSTESECPSRLATKGLANIRSIFAAFKARVLSRARANGCINGFRFLEVGVGSPGRIGR